MLLAELFGLESPSRDAHVHVSVETAFDRSERFVDPVAPDRTCAPVVVYHFDMLFGQKGWYTGLPDDLWTYAFEEGEFTSIPLGGRLGKVFKFGKQPVNAFL